MRSGMYTLLLKAGRTPAEATMIEDISLHACEQAVEALIRVCHTVPDNIYAETLVLACARVANQMNHAREFVSETVDRHRGV